MESLVQGLVLVLDLLFITYTIWLCRQVYLEVRHVPPFIRTRTAVSREVVDLFGALPEGSKFYDLGCGDGRIVRALAQANPGTPCTGVEMRIVPYVMARISQWRHPLPNVEYRYGSFVKHDLSGATHLYTYLYPQAMDALLPKLLQEVHGATLISLDFEFSKKKPARVVPVNAAEAGKLGRNFYIYEF